MMAFPAASRRHGTLAWHVLLACCYVFAATYVADSADSSDFFNATFDVYGDKAMGNDTRGCLTISSASQLGCISLCAQDVWCAAVYAVEHHGNAIGSWECHLCPLIWNVSTLETGNGLYSLAEYPLRGTPPPTLPYSDLVGSSIYLDNLVATYQCDVGRALMIVADYTSRVWTDIDLSCQLLMCSIESLYETLVTVTQIAWEPLNKYRFDPICHHDERPHGYTKCTAHSHWDQWDVLFTMCLPTTCYKSNLANRKIYAGTINVTVTGRPCQRWDSQTPRPHLFTLTSMFPEDGKDVTAAANYCRDPNAIHGYLWCYADDDLLTPFEKCAVPECE